MRIDLREAINPVYQDLLDEDARYLILYGGAGSGKSVFAAQKILYRLMSEPGHTLVCTRKVARTLLHSVWDLLWLQIEQWAVADHFRRVKSEMTIEYKPNGNRALCLGLDDREKIKSIAGVTGFWHEEPTELTAEDFHQLNLRLRGETAHYKQHILSFNPISNLHWLKRRFFEERERDAVVVKTTWRDNRFIDAAYQRELEALKDEDESLYRIYALGEWGALKGLVYEPFLMDEWPDRFDETIYGIDFGFNNPTAVLRIDLRDGEAWVTEECYGRGMTTADVIATLGDRGVSPTAPIYADGAEPDRIEELIRAGYTALPADKSPGSVNAGIAFCRSVRIHSRPENENLNNENRSYKWREDRDGALLDEPAKYADHAMDALRYALYSHLGRTREIFLGKSHHNVRPR